MAQLVGHVVYKGGAFDGTTPVYDGEVTSATFGFMLGRKPDGIGKCFVAARVLGGAMSKSGENYRIVDCVTADDGLPTVYCEHVDTFLTGRPKTTDWIIAGVLGVALVLGVIVSANLSVLLYSVASERSGIGTVTYANYRRIRLGMTRREVIRILGPRYELTKEFDHDYGQVFQWRQDGDSVAIIGFHRGQVFSRSQVHLK